MFAIIRCRIFCLPAATQKFSAYGGGDRLVQGFDGETGGRDPGVDGRILRWIFRKSDVGVWTGLSWLRTGTGGGQL